MMKAGRNMKGNKTPDHVKLHLDMRMKQVAWLKEVRPLGGVVVAEEGQGAKPRLCHCRARGPPMM